MTPLAAVGLWVLLHWLALGCHAKLTPRPSRGELEVVVEGDSSLPEGDAAQQGSDGTLASDVAAAVPVPAAPAKADAPKGRGKKHRREPGDDQTEPPPGCPVRFFKFTNDFGGHSNQLITLLNAFEIAKEKNLTLVLPDFIEGLDKGRPLLYRPWALYDFDLFKEHGYCFVHRLPERHVALIKHTAYKIFRILPANVSRPYHLLKPSLRVDKEIKKMLRVLPENFTAVHRRIKMYTLFDCNRKGKGQNFTKPPFCWIRSEYVRQAQAENNITVPDPVFLATDTPKVRLVDIKNVRYHHGKAHPIYGTVVDWQVMTHAGFMIGHPSSSLSLNVCNTRRMRGKPLGCYRFPYCWDRPPYIAGWPCGTPVPGVATELWTAKQLKRLYEKEAIYQERDRLRAQEQA